MFMLFLIFFSSISSFSYLNLSTGHDLKTASGENYFFSQRDPQWRNDPIIDEYGVTQGTIESIGCAMTSSAMLLKYYGINTDPKMLNNWLNQNDGYASGGLLYWSKPAQYSTGVVTWIDNSMEDTWFFWDDDYQDWLKLKSELDNGYPVIVEVDSNLNTATLEGHWIVITQFLGGDITNPSNYKINDPWDYPQNPNKLLSHYYDAVYDNTIFALRFYHGQVSQNNPPYVPFNLHQFKSDGYTPIPEGGTIMEDRVVFKANIVDPEGDDVYLEIELRQINEPFQNVATSETISGSYPSGSTITISRGWLVNSPYHWQCRARDSKGAYSAWIEYGSSGDIDFIINTPSTGEPTITSSLRLRTGPYYLGDTITGLFTIKNKGTMPITFDILTIGGRDNDDQVADFSHKTNIYLGAGQSYYYQGSLTLNKVGNYHFFCAYNAQGVWNTAIPTEPGVTNVVDITVIPPEPIPTIISSLSISPQGVYSEGDVLSGEFSIKNKGTASITFEELTIRGQDPTNQLVKFDPAYWVTLTPGNTYDYQGIFTLTKSGGYNFYCSYKIPGGVWDDIIPTEPGRINSITINVYPLGTKLDYYLQSIGISSPTVSLKAEREFVEIWAADDLLFPEGDLRNDDPYNLVISDEMYQYLADEFNNVIYPNTIGEFGKPLDRDGTNTIFEQAGFSSNYWDWLAADNPQKVILEVVNLRDDSYYNPTYPAYSISWSSPEQNSLWYNRNIIRIDPWRLWRLLGYEGQVWFPERPDLTVVVPYCMESSITDWFEYLIQYDNPTQPTWYEVYGTGSNLAIRVSPDGEVIKRIPDGYVIKVIDKSGIEYGGYIWWKVIDIIHEDKCKIEGWCASEYLRYMDQNDLADKAKRIDDVNLRKTTIIEAFSHYYQNNDQSSNLYSSINNEGGDSFLEQDLSIFRENGFPIEIMLGMAIAETGSFYFDNEVYRPEPIEPYPYLKYGGIGIMQITFEENQGKGCYIKTYADICRKADTSEIFFYPGDPNGRYKHFYYGNTKQGIYANIKDGLRVLQEMYRYAINLNLNNPIAIADAVWRYNGGFNYLNRVSDAILSLSNIYGNDYKTILQSYGISPLSDSEIISWANILKNHILAIRKSPVNLVVYDESNRKTGVLDGQLFLEIPNSDYSDGRIIIFNPLEDLKYNVIGFETGTYGLEISLSTEESSIVLNSSGIPINSYEIHQYSIDWYALSQGEEGVNIEIDSDGDGSIDYSLTSDAELNTAEYVAETLTWSYEDDALQDGVIFDLEAPDTTLLEPIKIYIKEPGEGNPILHYEYLTYNPETQSWQSLTFDTTQLPDGYYELVVEIRDKSGSTSSTTFSFIIANWAALELLPSTACDRAGRTMPVKFSLRVIEQVNPSIPFVINQEVEIRIYDESDPETILQCSTYGDSSTDYRIDVQAEHYIANFKTAKKAAVYVVEIYRKGYMIGFFTFETYDKDKDATIESMQVFPTLLVIQNDLMGFSLIVQLLGIAYLLAISRKKYIH